MVLGRGNSFLLLRLLELDHFKPTHGDGLTVPSLNLYTLGTQGSCGEHGSSGLALLDAPDL